ncbi:MULTISPECIES: alpha/beta fold hydrolase [unclassified Psychrobacter]|uniref:alpha/beta fold hydrolase n=1 Tax=unclassified Psychrobacter TaxID=196806 RepID=UPI003FD12253
MITKHLTLIPTSDNEQTALWTVADDNPEHYVSKRQNVFLTHGTFSDKGVCMGIASYLAALGHTCYIMEWRGHGHSPVPKHKYKFETIALYDYKASFDYLFDELKLDHVHTVTHSGGGLCLTMFLIQNQQYIDKVSSATIFACQGYGAALNPISYIKVISAKIINRLYGYIPAKTFKLGPVNESYYTMVQWYDWNLHKNFKSSLLKQNGSALGATDALDDRFNYKKHMSKITIPIYAISGSGDRFIAPSRGCKLLLDDFGHDKNVFREYSTHSGDLEDYTHSRIIISRNAAKEIWPTVATWIETHSATSPCTSPQTNFT